MYDWVASFATSPYADLILFVIAFAEFARQRGARCFLFVSSLGADHDSGNFYLRTKGETERELQASGFDSLTILRPSLLIGDREEFRAGERASQLVLGLISPLLVGGLGRIRPVGAGQVAGAMRRLARSDERGIRIVESDEIRRIADPSS